MADIETARFIGGPQTPAQVWRSMMIVIGSWTAHDEGMFSVIETETGLWVGEVGPLHPYGWPGTEIGWSLHPDATGKGYAVEAAAATLDYAFDHLGWSDVIHCITPDNLASVRVARKLGSRNCGPGRLPEPFDAETVELWGQSRAEWQINRRSFST